MRIFIMEGMGHPHQARANQAHYDNVGSAAQQPVPAPSNNNQPADNSRKWYQPTWESKLTVLLVMVAALIVLVSFIAGVFGRTVSVSDFVDKDKYQAVFLGNEQVYFGKITGLTDRVMVLEDIYYLQVDQQLQPEQENTEQEPQVSLVKLGNELHGPEDRMFIYISEVVFWENLRNEGQVSQAIENYHQNGNDTINAGSESESVTPEPNTTPGDTGAEGNQE